MNAKKKRVALIQINVDFKSEYLPYSVGLLQAYASTVPSIVDHYEFLPPIYKRIEDFKSVVNGLADVSIAAFSIYVWNTRYSLAMARELKRLNPKIKIVFGGPNVPDKSENFLRKYPEVDFTVHGEGEIPFRDFLIAESTEEYFKVPSLRWIDSKSKLFHSNKKPERIKNLGEIPSPYTSGVFDSLIRANPDQVWNVLWETNRGCPFSCTYCDWGSATEVKLNKFDLNRLISELEWFSGNRIEYLMCADANFGILVRDVEIAKKVSELKLQNGYPKVFAATYTKNATDRSYEIAKILMETNLIRGYTVSTQSTDNETLKNVRRQNISQKSFETLQARFNSDGLPTYSDLIVGLPGETLESFKKGVDDVVNQGQFNKIYFTCLTVLPNSQMAEDTYRKSHQLKTVWGPQYNLHESVRDSKSEILEYQELVIGTKTLMEEDWREALVYSYLVSWLFFNKLLHVPIVTLSGLTGLSLGKFIEKFLSFSGECPDSSIGKTVKFFRDHVDQFQSGGAEYSQSDRWLKIWWQPDKIAFMNSCVKLSEFYNEATKILFDTLREMGIENFNEIVEDAIMLNKNLIRSPFEPRKKTVKARSNIYEYYLGRLSQNECNLVRLPVSYIIEDSNETWANENEWCKRMVWFGNKTSTYLASCSPVGSVKVKNLKSVARIDHKPYDSSLLKPYAFS